VSDEDVAKPSPVTPKSQTLSPVRSYSKQDAWTAALLFLGLAALFAMTRSGWLDDWDSVQFALGLDDFDVTKHQPHPPGYPVYIAAGKLIHFIVADHAATLTLLSSLSGAAVATMFYILSRRYLVWSISLCATIIMALMPLFWLQAGLPLTDMFGLVFVLSFLLVQGASTQTRRGDFFRRVVAGLIAGLSLGARPHITLLIVAYWCVDALVSSSATRKHFLTAVVAFAVGILGHRWTSNILVCLSLSI
jgi:Dolichyl-phosphate-mannose-protein mannosyltransferase